MKPKAALTVAALALAGAAMTGCGVINSWVGKGTEMVSAPHVTEMHELVITHYNALIASSENACNAVTVAGNGRSATLVEDPAMAYAATYRAITADYSSALENVFEAGLVGPPGFPSASQVKSVATDDWCAVAPKLRSLRGGV